MEIIEMYSVLFYTTD